MSSLVGKLFVHSSGKGPYRVLHLATATQDLRRMVVYEQLYHHEKFPQGTVWVRSLEEFESKVSKDGAEVPRFSLVAD